MALISGSDRENIPCLRPFITLRYEPFGAIIFNRFLGMERTLDPAQAYVAGLCDGQNSVERVMHLVQSRFNLDETGSKACVFLAFSRLAEILALRIERGTESAKSALPDIPEFPQGQADLSAPKRVIWEVSYRCNLHCPHCFTDSGRTMKDELSTERAFELIDMLDENKVLYLLLSGGEPLLRPDIIPILRRLADTGMRAEFVTNGVRLPKKVLEALRELPIFQAQVSIDGIGGDHDRFRARGGAFDKAVANIKKLQEAGVAVTISYTATSETLPGLNGVIDLAAELGCNGFKAIPFFSTGRGSRNDRLRLSPQDNYYLCKTMVERGKELKGRLRLFSETCFPFLLETGQTSSVGSGMGCSAGTDTLCIGAEGMAYPCPFLHAFPLGNVMDRGLKEIWDNAPTLRTLRSIDNKNMKGPCRSCKFASNLCGGGCRAAAFYESGDLMATDPTCFKSLIK